MNRYCSPQADLQPFIWGAHPAWDWGLDLWALLGSEMWGHPVETQPNWMNPEDFQNPQFMLAFCKLMQMAKENNNKVNWQKQLAFWFLLATSFTILLKKL